MAPPQTLQVLEQARVSPPPGSVADSSLLLTYFDIIWLQVPPVQRVFFYRLNHTKTHVTETTIPNLKNSLSLSLKLFYPLAGNLIHSPETGDHFIRYFGGDSVPLTIAESDGDFNLLSSNHAKDVTLFHPLVPPLPNPDAQKKPLLALQVTIFPNSGISIGINMHHAVADGSSSVHFMKSWASICKSGGDVSTVTRLPIFDRTIAATLEQIKKKFFREMEAVKVDQGLEAVEVKKTHDSDAVRATFVLTPSDIERLRPRVLARADPSQKPAHYSSFVLTCAYVWICQVKAKKIDGDNQVNFAFAVDCRTRLDPPLPPEYFGNCIGACFAHAKADHLDGDDGILMASETIRRALHELSRDILKDAEFWISKFMALTRQLIISVAGSPRFRVYETDYGWCRPEKVDVISIEKTGAISLAESRDVEGGIEIGLALPMYQMENFVSFFEEGLKVLS